MVGFNWVRARDLVVQKKYQKALTRLDRIRFIRGKRIRPMGQWTAEYYILQGHAFYSLGDKERAADCIKHGLHEMAKEPHYTDFDREYLTAYAASAHADLDLGIENEVDIEQVDLDPVQPEIKIYFPLTSHPAWDA